MFSVGSISWEFVKIVFWIFILEMCYFSFGFFFNDFKNGLGEWQASVVASESVIIHGQGVEGNYGDW